MPDQWSKHSKHFFKQLLNLFAADNGLNDYLYKTFGKWKHDYFLNGRHSARGLLAVANSLDRYQDCLLLQTENKVSWSEHRPGYIQLHKYHEYTLCSKISLDGPDTAGVAS